MPLASAIDHTAGSEATQFSGIHQRFAALAFQYLTFHLALLYRVQWLLSSHCNDIKIFQVEFLAGQFGCSYCTHAKDNQSDWETKAKAINQHRTVVGRCEGLSIIDGRNAVLLRIAQFWLLSPMVNQWSFPYQKCLLCSSTMVNSNPS